jgi:hypothetical protein
MGKTRYDEAYERGVRDGKEGDLLDDIIMGLGLGDMIPPHTKEWEIYKKGYEWGAEHRHEGRDEGSSSDSDSDDKSDSGCYLTTACVDVMGLSDDCFELGVLRRFRDRVLLPTCHGRKAVEEYYRIAPEIVKAVEEQEGDNAQRVWHWVYNDIRRAVSLVLSGNFEEAFRHYQEMTLRLRKKYLD